MDDAEQHSCDANIMGTCEESYYIIIFLVVVSGLVCLCIGACYIRKVQQSHDTRLMGRLLDPLLPNAARRYLFRNSQLENEWMCIICGFDNKPDSKHCTMCGTDHDFSIDYKSKKLEEKRRKKLEKQRKEKERERKEAQKRKSEGAVSISIPDDAQIIASVSFNLRNPGSSRKYNPNDSSSIAAATLLSPEKRSEAINYRRLNQLSLRQKSARRRKIWQRKIDEETGLLTWRKVPINEIRVADARFGYTPRNSTDGKKSLSIFWSDSDSDIESGSRNLTSVVSHGTAGGGDNDDSDRQHSGESLGAAKYLRDLMSAARSGGASSKTSTNSRNKAVLSAATSGNNNNNCGGEGGGSEGTGSGPAGSDNSGDLRGPLLGSNYAGGGESNRHFNKKCAGGGGKKKKRHDSFGDDSAILSASPAFTSVFDRDGGLQWESVEDGKTVPPIAQGRGPIGTFAVSNVMHASTGTIQQRNSAGTGAFETPPRAGRSSVSGSNNHNNNNDNNNGIAGGESFSANVDIYDLEAVAAMTFKDKQIWFLERMSELQIPWAEGCMKFDVRRASVFNDTLRIYSKIPTQDWHKWLRIQFRGEPGVDAGGLEREWFGLLLNHILAPSTGLFVACDNTATGMYHIDPTSEQTNPDHLRCFHFVGTLFGKAIMEQQPIKANLSLPLRKQILSVPITFSDLEFVDEELYRNLIWLKTNDNIEELQLDFSITYTSPAGTAVNYDLKEGGSDIIVTDDNKEEYLQLRLRHRMLDSIKPQLEMFLSGLYEVIPADLLSVFDYQELDLLICGVPDIDVLDWTRHTEYLGEYSKLGPRGQVIRWFWLAVESMSNEERVRLLQFTTGCARLPAQGFKALQSSDGKYRKFNIQSIGKAVSSSSSSSIIYASFCRKVYGYYTYCHPVCT